MWYLGLTVVPGDSGDNGWAVIIVPVPTGGYDSYKNRLIETTLNENNLRFCTL